MVKYDIITSGSGLVDAFVDTGLKEAQSRVCFPVGTKIKIGGIKFSIGGGGINTAASFAKMGLKTGFLGKVGSGYNSLIILREIKKRKIDFIGVQSKEHAGYSIILESDKKHRTILTYKGASDNLKFSEINKSKLNTKWIHITSAGDETFRTQNKLVDYASKNNIKISFNPSSYQVKNGINHISHILKNTYILSLNKEEAEMLAGKKNHVYKKLHKLGPEIVIITNGENPGLVYDGEFIYRYYPNKVNVSECTGAGDAFSSGFVAGFFKTKDIVKSIKIAMANSESVIVRKRANTGVLSWNEAERIIKAKTFKVKKEIV